MRTSVSLGGVGAWLEGGLDTPELVLGPRDIEHIGRRALSVRAFLPDRRTLNTFVQFVHKRLSQRLFTRFEIGGVPSLQRILILDSPGL